MVRFLLGEINNAIYRRLNSYRDFTNLETLLLCSIRDHGPMLVQVLEANNNYAYLGLVLRVHGLSSSGQGSQILEGCLCPLCVLPKEYMISYIHVFNTTQYVVDIVSS